MNGPGGNSDAAEKWIVEIVEKVSRGFVGEHTSHVLGPNNTAHIVYFDYINGNLRHAQNTPDGWAVEDIDRDGTVGQFLSIARNEQGNIFVVYRDQGKNQLKMASFHQGRWNFEVVDKEPFASFDTSICVDSQGNIYISYYNFSQGYLKFATRDKGAWLTEVVDDGQGKSNAIGGFTSIKVDPTGRVHISYIDSKNGLLKYAVRKDSSWSIETADDSEFVGNFTSLALDAGGNPYISYTVDKRPNKPDLWLAKKLDGRWTNELVEAAEITGNYNSIVVDGHSNVYISYSAMRKLKLATYLGGQWKHELIDSGGTVTYTSLSIDEAGMPHIAYNDVNNGIKYARKVRTA